MYHGDEQCVELLNETIQGQAVQGNDELPAGQRDWAVGHSAAFGAPDSLLDELRSYKADEDIEEVISATPESYASGGLSSTTRSELAALMEHTATRRGPW